MKHRLGLLICGVMLIAATPLWADRAPDPGTLKGFGGGEGFSVHVAGSPSLGFNASKISFVDAHPDRMASFDFGKIVSSPSTNWVRASRDGIFDEVVPNSMAVAEPGALPLALLGLVSVGCLFRRRRESQTTI